MRNAKNDSFVGAAMTLVLMVAAFCACVTTTKAQQYLNMQEGGSLPLPSGVTPDYSVETSARLSFRPNPVGVGQPVLINAWIVPPVHVSRYLKDLTIIITKPDGNQQTFKKNSYRADTTTWVEFTPDTPGVWKIKFEFPGAYFPAGNYTVYPGAAVVAPGVVNFPYSCYYKPSSDGPYELVVQTEPVKSWPPHPLPNDYWTRPIYPENREWWSIAGWYPPWGIIGKEGGVWPENTNRYAQSIYRYVPYVQGPNSAHIFRKLVRAIGGLIGGPFETYSWTSGGGGPSIIYAGRCYQSITKVVDGEPKSVWQCYDLRTGEIFWERTGVTQIPTLVTYWVGYGEVPGALPIFGRNVFLTYVGGGNLTYYSPLTGAALYNVSISPLTTGTLYANYDHPYFLSVQDLGAIAGPDRYRLINWSAFGDYSLLTVRNVRLQVVNNRSWPFSSLGVVDYETGVAVVTRSRTNPGTGTPIHIDVMAADLYTGGLLWNITADVSYNIWPGETIADHGKVAIRFDDGYLYCWDLRSGKFLWKSEISSWPWGTFGAYGISSYGGKIIVGQYDGIVAYDWNTGKVVWLYQYKAPYPYETPYQDNYPFFSSSPLIADGKVYMPNSEHTATQPITRGWKLHCVDAETGEGIWSLSGTGSIMSIAEGYLVFSNSYDGCMYVIGKGPSATTVSATPKVVAKGQSIVIEGTVLDVSPGTQDSSVKLRFPNGVPAVADECMGGWMEYVYMQLPRPSDVKGVWVTFDVIGPDGKWEHVGGTHTDDSGMFSIPWTPPAEGLYTIVITFPGSESYWPSYTETSVLVTSAPPTPEMPEIPASIDYSPMFTGVYVAVAIAILIGLYSIYDHRKLKK